jgi:hypothetical protein
MSGSLDDSLVRVARKFAVLGDLLCAPRTRTTSCPGHPGGPAAESARATKNSRVLRCAPRSDNELSGAPGNTPSHGVRGQTKNSSHDGGLPALLYWDGSGTTRGGRDFDHFITELAFGDFLQRDVHERQLGVKRNERTKALPELAHPLGYNVDQNLGALHGFEGILNEGLFHNSSPKGKGQIPSSGKIRVWGEDGITQAYLSTIFFGVGPR